MLSRPGLDLMLVRQGARLEGEHPQDLSSIQVARLQLMDNCRALQGAAQYGHKQIGRRFQADFYVALDVRLYFTPARS
jgi:hypothetical protein